MFLKFNTYGHKSSEIQTYSKTDEPIGTGIFNKCYRLLN